MASSSFIVFVLVLVTISSPLLLQIQARESQFFSKVPNKPTETVVLPDKEQEQKSQEETEQQQQPEFVQQNQNGYGLYGQENTETKAGVQTHTPGTYASEKYYDNDRNGARTEELWNNNGEKYYSRKDQSDEDSLSFDDSFDTETENGNGEAFYDNNNNGVGTEHYTTYDSQTQKDNTGETFYRNTDRNSHFGSQLGRTETNYDDNRFDNGFTNELNSRYNTYRTATQNRGASNVARQGMSDTRFLENGRYYYDLNKEQNTYNKYRSNEVDRVNTNNLYDNSGAENYEFNTMDEYEKSRQNQYDP